MIRLENVHKTLGEVEILRGLSLHVKQGEVLVIVGKSGQGKSVTLKHMVGLMLPDEGSVTVDGINLSLASASELEEVRSRIGLVFQSSALVNWLSVFDNIALPLRETLSLKEPEVKDRVNESLSKVHLEGQGYKMPSDISGGMKKRVGIARAIVTHPQILLYDEPTSGLDPVTGNAMDDLILEMQESAEATSVVVSHDLMSAFRIADRIAMIGQGEIIAVGPPDKIRSHPHPEVQAFIRSGLGQE